MQDWPAQSSSLSDPRVEELQRQINTLIEQIAALVAGPPPSRAASLIHETQEESAPVLSPAAPVAAGHAALIALSLINEDQESADIAFLCTDLIGDAGARIPAARVSFDPSRVTLAPGHTHPVEAQVLVPAGTPEGVYAGLMRASRLEALHAVLVVHVEAVRGP